MVRKIQRYGYRPDLGDARDHLYLNTGAVRPAHIDLSPKMPPCWDQGQLGSCTGFGLTAIVCYLHGFVGSQLWLYYRERLLEHTTRQDAGAEIRDGMKVLASQGLPDEKLWPYSDDKKTFKKAPPKAVNAAAKVNLIQTYQRLNGLADYLDCLANGFPFVIGITVYSSFMSDAVATTGLVPMPAANDQVEGGHCISIFGYDDTKKLFKCRNSWGTQWGDNGHFYLPYDYLASNDLANDAWVCTKAAM